MKVKLNLNKAQNHQYLEKNHSRDNKKTHSNQVSFGVRGADFVVRPMDFIARGGLCASFMIQDFGGLIVPRIYTGFHRNKDRTGEYNYSEAAEVAIRELATGPPMFMIPLAGLWVFKSAFGKACDVPFEHIDALGHIFSKNADKYLKTPKHIKENYYFDVMKNVLSNSAPAVDLDANVIAQEYAERLIDIEKAPKKKILDVLSGKTVSNTAQDKIAKLADDFVSISKKTCNDSSANFRMATLSVQKDKKVSTSFQNLLNHITNYTDDVTSYINKKGLKLNVKSYIDEFNVNRIFMRKVTSLSMLAGVVGFCLFIPKLYQLSAKNPALKGLQRDDVCDKSSDKKACGAKVAKILANGTKSPQMSPLEYFSLPFKKLQNVQQEPKIK